MSLPLFSVLNFISMLFIFVYASAGAASTFSLQGRILRPDGTVLSTSSVDFRVRILSPDTNACILYEESINKNMSGSGGLFNISLNDGSGIRTDGLPHLFEKTFSNQTAFAIPASKCGSGIGTVTYSPSVNDERKMIVYFRESGSPSWEQMPAMTISHSSFANESAESSKVGGFAATNMCRVVDSGGAPALATPFTSAQFAELISVASGNYTKVAASGAISLPTIAGNATSPSAGQMWYDSTAGAFKYYDGAVKTLGAATGSVTSVIAGTGLTGGTITASGTIAVDVGVTAGKIVQVATGNKLPVIDGSNLTNVVATNGFVDGANSSTSGNIATTGTGTLTSAGQFSASSGAASTSTTTGAAVITGGIGISGAQYLGGSFNQTGTGDHVQSYSGVANAASISANALTSGSILDLSSTSTAAVAGNTGLNIAVSGANATAGMTRHGFKSAVTATGSTSTNVAGYFSATGGTNNYGLIVGNGNVGIGTATPTQKLDVNGNITLSSANSEISATNDLSIRSRNNSHLTLDSGYGTIRLNPYGGPVAIGISLTCS